MSGRAGFKIPDLPAWRPKVPEVHQLILEYYKLPGNGAGGNCHVVLDDGNMRNHHIFEEWSWCVKRGDWRATWRALKNKPLTS